jgi:hypothetical protein
MATELPEHETGLWPMATGLAEHETGLWPMATGLAEHPSGRWPTAMEVSEPETTVGQWPRTFRSTRPTIFRRSSRSGTSGADFQVDHRFPAARRGFSAAHGVLGVQARTIRGSVVSRAGIWPTARRPRSFELEIETHAFPRAASLPHSRSSATIRRCRPAVTVRASRWVDADGVSIHSTHSSTSALEK